MGNGVLSPGSAPIAVRTPSTTGAGGTRLSVQMSRRLLWSRDGAYRLVSPTIVGPVHVDFDAEGAGALVVAGLFVAAGDLDLET